MAYGYAALAIGGWSTAATAFKLALDLLDPVQLLALASFSSTGILGIVLWIEKKWVLIRYQTSAQVALSALQGFLNPCAYYVILLQAYQRLPAQAAMSLNYTWPLVLALLAIPILGESFRLRTIVALGLSLLGITLITTQGHWQSLDIEDPIGVFLALGSSLLWALYWLSTVKDERDTVLKLFTAFCFGSGFISGLLFLGSEVRWPTPVELLLGAYIGLAEMGLAFVFWLKALELADHRGKIANLVYISPFLSLLWVSQILKERILFTSLLGLMLIVSGILWQSQGKPTEASTPNSKTE
jgi:drug/metabolite transporter (DMT)-like permease